MVFFIIIFIITLEKCIILDNTWAVAPDKNTSIKAYFLKSEKTQFPLIISHAQVCRRDLQIRLFTDKAKLLSDKT